jgi:hypothetical protein
VAGGGVRETGGGDNEEKIRIEREREREREKREERREKRILKTCVKICRGLIIKITSFFHLLRNRCLQVRV